MDQCLNTSKDLTQTVAVMRCITLKETDEIHPFCALLSSVNAGDINLSQTLTH